MYTVFIIMSCKTSLSTEVQGPSLTPERDVAMAPSTGTVLVCALAIASLLTLGAHAPEGYSTWSVCLSVCVCVCVFSLFWHLAQSGVQTAVSATSARYGHEI